jgi:hypothetical protein
MTTCPSCGAAEEKQQQQPPPTRRRHYVCGSYATDNHPEWNHQSDLCRAWQAIRNVRNLATTDGETPAQLLARVKEMLAL